MSFPTGRLIDESVPWLMASKQYAKAEKIIRRGAKFNKVPVTDDLFQETKPLTSTDHETKALASPPTTNKENNVSGSTTSLKKRVFGSSLSISSVAEALGMYLGNGFQIFIVDNLNRGFGMSYYISIMRKFMNMLTYSISRIL